MKGNKGYKAVNIEQAHLFIFGAACLLASFSMAKIVDCFWFPGLFSWKTIFSESVTTLILISVIVYILRIQSTFAALKILLAKLPASTIYEYLNTEARRVEIALARSLLAREGTFVKNPEKVVSRTSAGPGCAPVEFPVTPRYRRASRISSIRMKKFDTLLGSIRANLPVIPIVLRGRFISDPDTQPWLTVSGYQSRN